LTNWLTAGLRMRYVDRLPGQQIGSYLTVDTQMTFILTRSLELRLSGQNLTNKTHSEFQSELARSSSLVERSFYAAIKLGM